MYLEQHSRPSEAGVGFDELEDWLGVAGRTSLR